MLQNLKDKLSKSKVLVASAGVAVIGASQAFAGTGLLTTVDTTGATADVTLVIVALVGLGVLIMGGRKVLSLLGH